MRQDQPLLMGSALVIALAALQQKVLVLVETKDLKRMRASDLREFDGSNGRKIYVGADGLVFDVTKARDLYGSGGTYAAFAGRDASRMLARGVLATNDDEDRAPLSLTQRAALKAWVAALQSKYEVVGALETRLDLELLEAASAGKKDEIRKLAKKGADVFTKDVAGDAAIHLAARYGDADCCKAIIDIGGPEILRMTGSKNRPPLHFAAEAKDRPDAFRYFLSDSACDPNVLANDDWTPLHAAAQAGAQAQVDLLLKRTDVRVDPASSAGVTPLLAAATFGHLAICKALIRHGADPNKLGPRSKTPGDWAKVKGHTHVSDFLQAAAASGNKQRTSSPIVSS